MMRIFAAAATTAILLAGAARAQVASVTALTSSNTLVTFNSNAPGTILSTVPVTGIAAGENLRSIDYRPIDGLLIGFAYSDAQGSGDVYTINAAGVASTINHLVFGVNGRYQIDFNPTANALRIVNSAAGNNNFRAPTGGTGALATDTALNPGTPFIQANAYSRNVPGGGANGATTLYAIDSTSGNLVSQGSIDFFTGSGTSPNTGTLTAIALLSGVTASSVVGFDIFGGGVSSPGSAFLASGSTFFTLDLSTGAATSVGAIGSGTLGILDIAAAPVPEPGSLTLLGIGAVGLYRVARRRKA